MPPTTKDDPGAEYLERARAFVPELAAAAPEIERQRELPESVVAAMVERGFFRMLLPRSTRPSTTPSGSSRRRSISSAAAASSGANARARHR